LASSASDFTTGSVFTIDGGFTLTWIAIRQSDLKD
jgi:hypothetical protein